MFTHNVLLAMPSPDRSEDRGPISKDQAIQLFRDFPFERELEKRKSDADLTVPTLTFTDEKDGSSFAIWSSDPGKFLIWVPEIFGLVDNINNRFEVAECLALFFDGEVDALDERLGRLEANTQKND